MSGDIKPFVKWVGSKRNIASQIAYNYMPESFKDYHEPFLGSGAMFFVLENSRFNYAYLNDLNPNLVKTFVAVQTNPEKLIQKLREHEDNHSKDYYYAMRKIYNNNQAISIIYRASLFIYLNKTCFNGLYRVNKKGEFNASWGYYDSPSICDEQSLLAASEKLWNKSLVSCGDFEETVPESGDLVYCDPPYDSTFTKYSSEMFSATDQARLRDKCFEWLHKGAHVVISLNDTEFVRELYSSPVWEVHEIEATRQVSAKASTRGKETELVIVGSP